MTKDAYSLGRMAYWGWPTREGTEGRVLKIRRGACHGEGPHPSIDVLGRLRTPAVAQKLSTLVTSVSREIDYEHHLI